MDDSYEDMFNKLHDEVIGTDDSWEDDDCFEDASLFITVTTTEGHRVMLKSSDISAIEEDVADVGKITRIGMSNGNWFNVKEQFDEVAKMID